MKKTLLLLSFSFIYLAFAGACFAEFYPFAFPKDETVIFNNFTPNEKPAKVINTYSKSGKNFVIKQMEENGNVTKIVIDKNFIPISYKKVNRSGEMLEFAAYSKGKLTISIPAKRVNKSVSLPSTYYDSFTLNYALRKFKFGKTDSIYINLAYHDPGNTRVVKMQVKNKGIETVKIKSGSFKCYKLEMGTCNPLDVAIWPYKYYFWFTTDANHFFVKFQGRQRDSSSITSELAIYKVGKKYIVKSADAGGDKPGPSALLLN